MQRAGHVGVWRTGGAPRQANPSTTARRSPGRWIPGRLVDIRGGRLNPTTGVYAVGVTDGAPMHPTGLAAAVAGSMVSLAWNSVGGTGITYLVYRSTVSGGPYTNIASTSSASYTQTGVAAGTYYYVITASNGFESGYSDEARATV